ncbi:intradiol ring-cleavage dioxygenase [Crepidotus variabilis]|uniref:Intradiol ring-cleavage dioxygenase n=1 Tax=Crepidotus variabilis TaxID=179855 RepID=A0A9P6E9X3_9AGAR|nr:intradiol ring-cleavage dioxygenase [Crepidotus variabilis]
MDSEAYFKQHSIAEAERRKIDVGKLPQHLSMTPETITSNVLEISSQNLDKNDRKHILIRSLVSHLHAFVKETSLTTEEWTMGLEFLTEVGKMSADVRPEFILLSDILGVSALMNSINDGKPPGATQSTVEGPFYTQNTQEVENGGSISSEGKGDYMYLEGRILDIQGNPIAGAIIDTWESDSTGTYDVASSDPTKPECRGRITSKPDGSYSFRATVPVPYSIPDDGPVHRLLVATGRHPVRPAHLHFCIQSPNYETLVTALFFKGDAFNTSDAVHGVKSSLVVEPQLINDISVTKARGFRDEKPHMYLKQDFILANPQEAQDYRKTLHAKLGGVN